MILIIIYILIYSCNGFIGSINPIRNKNIILKSIEDDKISQFLPPTTAPFVVPPLDPVSINTTHIYNHYLYY